MENSTYVNQLITKKILLEHSSVILIFSVIAVIFTFPVILDFTTEAAGLDCYDQCHMMWRIWWADFSFENNLDFHHSNYMFYPDGTGIGGNLAYFTTFIGFLLVQFLDYITTWNVIWFLGLVFGGYGCYLLANNFNKNYLSSIIAGIIFTFTTYHMVHSLLHIGLSMIVWLPIFVLFLFKLLEKQSKYYAIVGGIIFFLVSLTHLYYTVFILLFSIVFFTVYVFRQKKVSSKTFITNFSILLTIGLISTSILLLLNPTSSDEFSMRSLDEHIEYSVSLENLILPNSMQTTQIISNYEMNTSFYSFFDSPIMYPNVEAMVFLGYSVIFLSALAVIRYRRNHIWFWLLICGIFILMSFGPELKILYESTGITLPHKVFYDTIPQWDEIRAPARFIVMANMALAILASYAVYGLIKNKFSSFKQQLMLTAVIGFVILFEFSMIPFPTFSESIPDFYEEIKNDESKFAVLPVPIGGIGDYGLMSDPLVLYHQLHLEKPIYGGHESRITHETLSNTQTYFLNMFHIMGSKDDVIKQDLAIHGLSLFDYFDIKYVILQKGYAFIPNTLVDENIDFDVGYGVWNEEEIQEVQDVIAPTDSQNSRPLNPFDDLMEKYMAGETSGSLALFWPERVQIMSEILSGDGPVYEDDVVVVYKIPKPNSSEPFLVLGSGWHVFDADTMLRATMKNSEILIVNPTNSEMYATLNVVLSSSEKEKTITVSVNNGKQSRINIHPAFQDIQVKNLILKPGVNVVTFDTNEFTVMEYSLQGTEIDKRQKTTISFNVQSISITIQP